MSFQVIKVREYTSEGLTFLKFLWKTGSHFESDLNEIRRLVEIYRIIIIHFTIDEVNPGQSFLNEVLSNVKQRQNIADLGRFVVLKLERTWAHKVANK